jgi:hypothetical protein
MRERRAAGATSRQFFLDDVPGREIEDDGVVVGEDFAVTASQIPDDARRLVGVWFDASAREPVELERAAPAVFERRP